MSKHRASTTTVLATAKAAAEHSVGKKMKIRVNETTCWLGVIKECHVNSFEGRPLGFNVTLELPTGRIMKFTTREVPIR